MSKKVKNLITSEVAGRLKDVDGVAVISPRGLDGNKNNAIRRKLRAQNLRMTVVKNTLARRAVGEGKLKGFDALLDGPSALIYGDASIAAIARLLLAEKKADDKLELRGVFFDGELYEGAAGVEQASKLPTREEAIATIVAMILAPGGKLGGILKGQAGKIAALIKAVEERAEKAGGAAPAADAAPVTDAPALAVADAPAPVGGAPAPEADAASPVADAAAPATDAPPAADAAPSA